MTSTNMFQGLDTDGKPSSRVLRPPGGGSSDLFGPCDEVSAARRPNKMSSTIFAGPEAPQESPKRSNPPGGKSSGIFSEAPTKSPAPQQRPALPAGVSSNIFGEAGGSPPVARPHPHPNKPKDNIGIHGTPRPDAPEQKQASPKKASSPAPPAGVQPAPAEPAPRPEQEGSGVEDHEPRLGPRPRSHNKVIQPPGGKSSVVFY